MLQGIDHQLNEWQRCLQSCLTLLQSAVETFNGISSGDVLDEVVGSMEGKAYLQSKINCFTEICLSEINTHSCMCLEHSQ
jgi:hypothetical protein